MEKIFKETKFYHKAHFFGTRFENANFEGAKFLDKVFFNG